MGRRPDKRRAPGHHTGGTSKNFNATDHTVLRPTLTPGQVREDTVYADVMLRCAWLREHALRLLETEPSGALSAQLYEFADLLEVAHRLRWFA